MSIWPNPLVIVIRFFFCVFDRHKPNRVFVVGVRLFVVTKDWAFVTGAILDFVVVCVLAMHDRVVTISNDVAVTVAAIYSHELSP